jgi:hypothetical protein
MGLSLFFCILTGYTLGGFFVLWLLPKTFQTRSNSKILIYEPMRSLLTLLAAYLIWLLPRSWYNSIESFALKRTGDSQRKAIAKSNL